LTFAGSRNFRVSFGHSLPSMPIEVLHFFAPFVNEDFSVMHGA
jgi:hypothetical protein